MAVQVFTKSIASAITATSAYDLGSAEFKKVYLEVPTMASATNLFIKAAIASDATFSRVQTVGADYFSITSTMTTGSTLGAAIDLGHKIKDPWIYIPTMTSITSVGLKISVDNSNFYNVTYPPANTASAQLPIDWSVTTFAANTSRFVPMPAGFRYCKIQVGTQQTDTSLNFQIIGMREDYTHDFVVATSVTDGRIVPIPAGFRYYKVELATGLTGTTATFNLICT